MMRKQWLPRPRQRRVAQQVDEGGRGGQFNQVRRLDKLNSEEAHMEYLKQLERSKKQKEVEMNLDSLLEGIFQIRVPDHIIQELTAETGDVFVDDDGRKTPMKVLTDKTATHQKESALAEDYK